MKKYSEVELKEMISNLKLMKKITTEMGGSLSNKSELDLTTYEMVLENHLNDKYKDLDEWLHKLIEKNGTTEY